MRFDNLILVIAVGILCVYFLLKKSTKSNRSKSDSYLDYDDFDIHDSDD